MKAFSPKYIKIVLIILLVIIAIPLCYAAIYNTVVNSNYFRYMKASELYVSGEYEEAANRYEEIGEYRDSAEKASNIRCALGKYYLNEGDYLRALDELKKGGPEASSDYIYALGMYSYNGESYENAIRFFEAANVYDSAEMRDKSTLMGAVKCLKSFDYDGVYKFIELVPEGYSYEGYSVDSINVFMEEYEDWLDEDIKEWQFKSGIIGAYEQKELIYEGWKTDVREFEDDISLSFKREIDDDLNLWVTISANIPYYATFAQDMKLQSNFMTFKNIEKTVKAEELSKQLDIDDKTIIIIGDDICVIKYRDEGTRQLPEENLPVERLSVCESEVSFEATN